MYKIVNLFCLRSPSVSSVYVAHRVVVAGQAASRRRTPRSVGRSEGGSAMTIVRVRESPLLRRLRFKSVCGSLNSLTPPQLDFTSKLKAE